VNRKDIIDAFHEKLINTPENFNSAQLSGWSSAKSQRDRFKALLKGSEFSGGSIIDYGCGTGDLYKYLLTKKLDFKYRGVDQNPRMIEIAKNLHNANFQIIDLDQTDFGNVDYVFASGVFQYKDQIKKDYYVNLLKRLFERCNVAIAVNFLSSLRDDSEKVSEELYLHPSLVIDLARSISDFWSLDHSYHPGRGDMTLTLWNRQHQANWRRPR
jgi:SAM-dependent methyltransferase